MKPHSLPLGTRPWIALLFAALASGCGATVDTGEPTGAPEGVPCDAPLPCDESSPIGARCCLEGREGACCSDHRCGVCDEHGACDWLLPD